MLRAPHRRRAITLNELIVVIAVAGVLAVLAIFSTRTLVQRTKYSRVKEDHRVLTRALQNYQMDYAALPPHLQGLSSLERPTAYVASVPRDPFLHRGEATSEYLYLRLPIPGIAFVLVSAGPDQDFDVPPELLQVAEAAARQRVPGSGDRNAWEDTDAVGDPRPMSMSRGNSRASLLGVPDTLEEPAAPPAEALEAEALLGRYLTNNVWEPNSATLDGDIVTIVRY